MKNYLDFRNKIEYEKLKEPAEFLKNGGIVIFPTETVYGIGTNGLDENAVKRLYNVKQRPYSKPISLLVSDFSMIENICRDITAIEYKIMKVFFPGPLTIILKKKDIIPDIVTASQDTVGIRMPEGEIARKLVQLAGVPLATPSANITGKPSGINIESIIEDFNKQVDFVIDNGDSKIGQASTIVQVINERPVILRQGSISIDEIETYI